MANIPLQSISFPGLPDKYTTPVVDNTLTQAGAAADAKKVGDEVGAIKNDLSEKADKTDALSAYIVETETGAIASFTDGADDVPVKDLTVAIEPVQSGSGDPSPENVRPISGWTGANVTRTGANLWGGEKFKDDILRIVPSSSVDETAKTVGYQASFVNGKILFTNFKPNTQYTVILKGYNTSTETQATNLALEYTDGTQERGTDFINGVAIIKSNPTKSVKNIIGVWSTQITYLYYNECGVFKGDLTANDFVPYQGETYEVDWQTEAGTVYGGTLDVTTGVLTVDRALWTKNTSAMNNDENFPGWRNSGIKDIVGSGINANFTNQTLNVGTKYSVNTQSGDILFLPMNGYNKTQAEWQALALNVQIVAELATPQTYQLTPEEVSTILGQNNIFADCGSVNVQYRADTKLYIGKVLSA